MSRVLRRYAGGTPVASFLRFASARVGASGHVEALTPDRPSSCGDRRKPCSSGRSALAARSEFAVAMGLEGDVGCRRAATPRPRHAHRRPVVGRGPGPMSVMSSSGVLHDLERDHGRCVKAGRSYGGGTSGQRLEFLMQPRPKAFRQAETDLRAGFAAGARIIDVRRSIGEVDHDGGPTSDAVRAGMAAPAVLTTALLRSLRAGTAR